MKRIYLSLAFFVFALTFASYAALAQDAGVPVDASPALLDVESSPLDSLGSLVDAVKGGNWRLVAALLLAFCMMFLSKIRDKIKWFKGDRGGAVAVMVLALGGGLSTALASDAAIDWKLLLGAVGVAWTAVGGYTWVKRLIWPKDKDA